MILGKQGLVTICEGAGPEGGQCWGLDERNGGGGISEAAGAGLMARRVRRGAGSDFRLAAFPRPAWPAVAAAPGTLRERPGPPRTAPELLRIPPEQPRLRPQALLRLGSAWPGPLSPRPGSGAGLGGAGRGCGGAARAMWYIMQSIQSKYSLSERLIRTIAAIRSFPRDNVEDLIGRVSPRGQAGLLEPPEGSGSL